jgi:hypothetical protein
LANDEAKPDTERSPEEEAAGQNKVSEAKTETRIEAETSLRRPPNWTTRFPKPDHSISAALGQKWMSKTASTSLVSSSPHAQTEEEDPADEGVEDEGRSDREGERRALQHHPGGDLDKTGVKGEEEG